MMSLIPDFKIGWCNGWLGTIPIILSMIILLIPKKDAAKRAVDISAYNMKEKSQTLTSTLMFFGAVLYSFFLPLKLDSKWFIVGLILYTFGCIPYIVSVVNFASTPPNEPIVKGVYKLSRNPMYFFSALTLLGIGFACGSWLMIMLVILYTTTNHLTVLAEEKYCTDKYGQSYRNYMTNVPRYLIFL
jgi:protein-S-isoprenylcysteine O-methyltransferase Ste14